MICYRDVTFCNFNRECKCGDGCGRALTDTVLKEAKEWWKDCEGEPPICLFVDKPECWEEKK